MDPNLQQPNDQAQPPVAPAVSPPPPAPVAQNGTEIINPNVSFTWEASEYVAHEKTAVWYLGLWVAVAILSGILALLKQWISIVVVVVMGLAIVVYSRKDPRILEYAVDEKGISINGKISVYRLFRSYAVHNQVGWREIDFEPAQRFAPRLTLLCEEDTFLQIENILQHHLPRVDRDPDLIERVSRFLKF